MKKINLAVFASTNGTDLQAIIDEIQSGNLPEVNLKFILSNKKDCYALERSKKSGFKTIFIDSSGKTREEYDLECKKYLDEEKIDLVILIGYMRIISDILVDSYKNKIINIHPSLLPKYAGGMNYNVHQEVLKNHEKESGCTLYFIDGGVDTGPIISQSKVTISPEETVDSLKDKVQAEEKKLILQGIRDFAKSKN